MTGTDRLQGEPVTGYDILDAREVRANRQKQWLCEQKDCCLVSVTMNIAGAIKSTPLICSGFSAGMELVDDMLRNLGVAVCRAEQWLLKTGCEAFRLVRGSPLELKRVMIGLEESSPFGRLLDIDVLGSDGVPLSRTQLGLPGRRCLVCGAPAQECGRSQRHSYDQLRDTTNRIIRTFLEERMADRVAAIACRSMLHEVLTTPKPGLVDRFNRGSHRDMDVFTFAASASALTPYLRSTYLQGFRSPDLTQLLIGLRASGRLAEEAMNRATSNVNTHKGLIYSLGLLCGALGRCEAQDQYALPALMEEVGALAGQAMADDFSPSSPTRFTTGHTLYKSHGIGGIRREAAEGFPSVCRIAYPILSQLLEHGLSENDAGAYTLLALLGRVTDTNMIARGGMEKAAAAKAAALALWPWDAVPDALPPLDVIRELDKQFISENLSPGGCADLLAIAFFLYYLSKERSSWQM